MKSLVDGDLKIAKFGTFLITVRTDRDTAKRTVLFDLAYQIYVYPLSREVLTVD